MNILFLGYWSANDPLSSATILPHLSILGTIDTIDKIVYCSIEREENTSDKIPITQTGIKHIPLHSKTRSLLILTKIGDFFLLKKSLYKIIRSEKIDKVLTRGVLAGALILPVCKKLGIPLFVESFEPHSQYMLYAGTWKKWYLRYIFQKRWEEKLKRYALGIMPVSHNYGKRILQEGVHQQKVKVVPCAVNMERFGYSNNLARRLREKLGWGNKIIGIYVGKFGDIYYDLHAFQIFRKAFDFFGDDLRVIILSEVSKIAVVRKLSNVGIDKANVLVTQASYDEVPQFLMAADFGFCLVRPTATSQYCSPIKNGEYWAAGLPILIPENIGDDSEIIAREGGGAVFDARDEESIGKALGVIANIIDDPDHRNRISSLAGKHRNFSVVENAYRYFLLS